ncbi:MAG: cation:proton antiporter [Vicinamibacterales bacterium]
MSPELTAEVLYVALLFLLFVVPRFLQRYRIPSAVTALAFGAIAGMGAPWLGSTALINDPVVSVLSTLGIVSLFLFAGLDVQVLELRREARVLIEHVLLGALALALVAFLAVQVSPLFDYTLDKRPAVLVALALMTPSTGFILDSLGRWGLSENERFWIRSKAIATELVALGVLFFILQSTSWGKFGMSAIALVAMIAVLPAVFRWFASAVIPHAPNSEFGFLMMVGAACAVITRILGVYYLVGAFAVGMAAQQFRNQLPALASLRMLGAVESFASLFVPFYFFHAGLELKAENFLWPALVLGVAMTALTLPLRLFKLAAHRRWRLGEKRAASLRIGIPMLPTTVFTLVIAQILRDVYFIPPTLFGGLIVYTLLNTLVPGLFLRASTPGFEDQLLIAGALSEQPATTPDTLPPGLKRIVEPPA